jgi:glucose-fructose oxidoreductase
MTSPDPLLTRRRFVGGLLPGVLAAAIAPQFLPSRVLGGEDAPNRRIRLGHIGVGGQGTSLLQNFLTVAGAQSVAVCDPFRSRREAAAALIREAGQPDPRLHVDFRELLADPNVDAVIIATPDHWHVPIGLAAVRAGKDLYVEKPLGYSLAQNQAMLNACREHHRIFQYGTQQRSQELLKRGVELVLNGAIGEVESIEVWAPAGAMGGGSLVPIPVPEGLDYELYIGPAPMRPCTADRITSAASWYCSDYAIGFIAGWGAHPLDVAIWATESDTAGPFTVRGTGQFPSPDQLFNALATWDADIAFADGVTMHFMSHDRAEPLVRAYRSDWQTDGTTFRGRKGWISLSRGGVAASDPSWLRQREIAGSRRVLYRNRYYQAFVDSVRERSPSVGPIEDAVRSDAISHLSVLAISSGETVTWDPHRYRIESPHALNQHLTRPVRGDWIQI